jgi:hypothetical protein
MSHGTNLTCSECHRAFGYRLIHSGFNDNAYAYCTQCGMTAILSGYGIPPDTGARSFEAITVQAETYLDPCACGGRFTRGAAPRCPYCNTALSADRLADAIEANAPGTAKGWRWQRNWTGLYCLIIEDRMVKDNWAGPR